MGKRTASKESKTINIEALTTGMNFAVTNYGFMSMSQTFTATSDIEIDTHNPSGGYKIEASSAQGNIVLLIGRRDTIHVF